MTQINLRDVWVNYAWIGMDEGWPEKEKVGTLIQTMNHGFVVKVSETYGRPATDEEVACWTGLRSPDWHAHYGSPSPGHG